MRKKDDLNIELYHSKEFSQLWDDMTHKLRNRFEASAYPSTCYILRDEKYDKGVPHKVISKHLEKSFPQECVVVDYREVKVKAKSNDFCPPHMEGTCVGYSYIWEYSRLLDKVVTISGFDGVREWLDSWMQRKEDFEYDKEYRLWLIKIYYPHVVNSGIQIQNDAIEPIPVEGDWDKLSYS